MVLIIVTTEKAAMCHCQHLINIMSFIPPTLTTPTLQISKLRFRQSYRELSGNCRNLSVDLNEIQAEVSCSLAVTFKPLLHHSHTNVHLATMSVSLVALESMS